MSIMSPKARGIKNLTTQWSCPWFDVIKFNYGVQTHYRMRHPKEGIVAITIREDGKFVMIKQRRPFFEKTNLEVVGGRAEPKESPRQTAIREIEEETGYRVISIKRLVSTAPWGASVFANEVCFIARVANRPEHKPSESDLPDSRVVVMDQAAILKAARAGRIEWFSLSMLLYYMQFVQKDDKVARKRRSR